MELDQKFVESFKQNFPNRDIKNLQYIDFKNTKHRVIEHRYFYYEYDPTTNTETQYYLSLEDNNGSYTWGEKEFTKATYTEIEDKVPDTYDMRNWIL